MSPVSICKGLVFDVSVNVSFLMDVTMESFLSKESGDVCANNELENNKAILIVVQI
jgi:hypothetical protein